MRNTWSKSIIMFIATFVKKQIETSDKQIEEKRKKLANETSIIVREDLQKNQVEVEITNFIKTSRGIQSLKFDPKHDILRLQNAKKDTDD